MPDILSQIVADKRRQVERAKAAVPLEQLRRQVAGAAPPRDFHAAVTRPGPLPNVIAEIKRASPSAGLIRADFDPPAIARAYRDHGASAISCLTDEKYFQGRLEYIAAIRQAVALPVLRKDFLIDPYQVVEARAAGADAVLLIGEILTDDQLADLLAEARSLGLAVLLEVHQSQTLMRLGPLLEEQPAGHCVLGINNRDLRSMKTDLTHTLRMLDLMPTGIPVVSESGIRSHADLMRLQAAGVRAVLVGEHLMRQAQPGEALARLLEGP